MAKPRRRKHAGRKSPGDLTGTRATALTVSPPSLMTPPAVGVPDLTAKLTPQQLAAFHLLCSGVKMSDAAARAGVNRGTLSKWRNHNVHFIAAYNAWHAQVIQLGHARLLAMGDKSLDVMDSALDEGDKRVALKVADSLGFFKPPSPGPQTPGGVAREHAEQDLRKRIKAARRSNSLKRAAPADFHTPRTVYGIDDRIWLLMLERKKALRLESPESRREREETQADEVEWDEEYTRIHQAIRFATEHVPITQPLRREPDPVDGGHTDGDKDFDLRSNTAEGGCAT